MLKDLAALTPPAVVCVAFVVGLVLLLRREMAPKRRVHEDSSREAEISGNNGIIDVEPVRAPVRDPVENTGERDEAARPSGGHGSPD